MLESVSPKKFYIAIDENIGWIYLAVFLPLRNQCQSSFVYELLLCRILEGLTHGKFSNFVKCVEKLISKMISYVTLQDAYIFHSDDMCEGMIFGSQTRYKVLSQLLSIAPYNVISIKNIKKSFMISSLHSSYKFKTIVCSTRCMYNFI